jgi:hypothetical protein
VEARAPTKRNGRDDALVVPRAGSGVARVRAAGAACRINSHDVTGCFGQYIRAWGVLVRGYLRRSAPLAMDVVDAVAILAFSLSCPAPGTAFAFEFAALWFRTLYGSTRRAVLRCGAVRASALSASLPLWPYVPGHSGSAAIGSAGRVHSGHVPDRPFWATPRGRPLGRGAGGSARCRSHEGGNAAVCRH